MEIGKHSYCVILAGGRGKRLWPMSREKYPKQFIDFFGSGHTQLQITYRRFARIFPSDHIFVCTTQQYEGLVYEQLPDIPHENVMAEPIHRNTAPSVSWATRRILQQNPEATLIVSPSDQMVINEERFCSSVIQGLDFVSRHDLLLVLGVVPTRPEPGYGYIQVGEPTEVDDVYKVQSFTEKPDREFARVFMESGEFLWNTGLFLARASYLRQRFIQIFPDALRRMREEFPDADIEQEQRYMGEHFSTLPNISMDKGMLELNERAYVMKCDFGWADLGTWHSMYESMQRGDGDNVVLDSQVMLEECSGNIIRLPKGRLGVFQGMEGFIVVEQDNVLLICKKGDSSSLLRKYVNEVGMKYGDEFV